MSLLEAVILALLQGATEFLPVSSSGHIVLASWVFGWDAPGLAFDVVVHAGTLAAVLIYFSRDWIRLFRGAVNGESVILGGGPGTKPADARRILALVILATAPLVVVGLFFRDAVGDSIRQPAIVGAFLLGTGVVIALGERVGRRIRDVGELPPIWAGIIGIAQAVAVVPGVSRSGASIVAGLFGGLTRESAARFSFYLAVPATLGPFLVLLLDLVQEGMPVGIGAAELGAAAAVSFVVALLAIRGFMNVLRRVNLWPFVWYCLAAGAAVVIAGAAGA